MELTKSNVRSDFTYARHLMRLAETALVNDDLDELNVIAHELLGAASTVLAYCEERGCAV